MDTTNEAGARLYGLLFGIRRSIRYHSRRQMFFDSLYKWTQVLSLISGSATVAVVIAKYTDCAIWLAAMVAIFSAFNLIFGFSGSARLHNDLARRFSELEKRIIRDQNPSMESIASFEVDRLDIEMVEPPILKTLDLLCHNELCRALGYGEEAMAKVGFWGRLFAQFFDLMNHKIPAPKSC
ncbi:MAG: hypothetical protein ACYDG4_16565 [Desulfuromonadaceae bacterium]